MRTAVNRKHTLASVTSKNMYVNRHVKLCEPVWTVVRTNWKPAPARPWSGAIIYGLVNWAGGGLFGLTNPWPPQFWCPNFPYFFVLQIAFSGGRTVYFFIEFTVVGLQIFLMLLQTGTALVWLQLLFWSFCYWIMFYSKVMESSPRQDLGDPTLYLRNPLFHHFSAIICLIENGVQHLWILMQS